MKKITGCITKECETNLLIRIKKIEGQIRGIRKMLEEKRYCIDILQQVTSVYESLRGVSKELIKNYLEQCVTSAILSKNKTRQKEIYKELIDVIYKYSR